MKNIFRLKRFIGKLKLLHLCIISTVIISCQKNDDIEKNSENLLLGVWANGFYDSNANTTTFERIDKLPDEDFGFSFDENCVFVQRTSGWCGTPPLNFSNTEGTFLLDKEIIKVNIQDFSGNFQWKIISLNEKALVVKRELTEQEKDHRDLMDLFYEIEELSISVSCIDSSEWNYVAYGSKACGGPQGYIAYSKNIDTTTFLQKVATYTKFENEYNKKWGIGSDCSVPIQPKSISCNNGQAVLEY